ncbi:MAG: 3-hydroxyacyl-CoA dehydrogenase/enoyl-CoA hydratase family protein [Planctomycetota bacterium]|nr:3-hydroxyacyl-CoA dehydrogenase/enoyl-CoA hydratase family protein [Planctomycetota bacterium]
MLIRKAAVIGAGTMGCGIATHLANAGVPCLLLDIVPEGEGERSRIATDAIGRALKSRPPSFMDPSDSSLLSAGNIEDDLEALGECDWIIEAVTEDLDVKRGIYERIAPHRRAGSIISSNTSGISLGLLTEGLDDDFRSSFLVTHFFNPPRYMYLLELVRGPDTSEEIFSAVREFAQKRLGKGVVECKDTPNFIANRIGVLCMGASCVYQEETGLSIEEIDAITGPVIGRPKTATFRLHDLVGIDVALMVMKNVYDLVPDDESRELFRAPAFLQRMVDEGKLGRKSGGGFYRKEGKEILVLDLESFEYQQAKEVSFSSLDSARKEKELPAKIQALAGGEDQASVYVWKLLSETMLYSAKMVPEICDDILSVDRALRWGFNWQLGPFELWDALGVRATADRLEKEGREIPALVEELLRGGSHSFYSTAGEGTKRRPSVFVPASRELESIEDRPGVILLDDVRMRSAPLRSNPSASVLDLGEGVLCVEFHSKMNTISGETLEMIREGVDAAEQEGCAGLIIGNQAPNFSLGANIKELAAAAVEKDWKAIDRMIRDFHETVLKVRYSSIPVVGVVQGMALGGGCEIPLACDAVQAAAETYIGLVELGVGLIPAGGGTREMACRAAEAVPPGYPVDSFGFLMRYFENISMAKTSGSAAEARQLGYLRPIDGISMNRDRALLDARTRVLAMAAYGYRPPAPRESVKVAGEAGIAELRILLSQYAGGGFISEYDEFLAGRFAYALCGGDIDGEFPVSEQYLLELELEVFLGLLGEQKTIDRITHTLKTGKPLRN